jgi:hypothetical protein
MKTVVLVALAVTFFESACFAITDPFSADPYQKPETVRPEAPSSVPVTEPGVDPNNPLPPFTAPIEDLFERKYWYLVLLDTKEVFTAPAHWDLRDWEVFGGITAGIVTVGAFDKEIEKAIRRAKSETFTDVLDHVQSLGNEYAIGVVGAFYLTGEVFKDPNAKSTAMDAISASGIASGVIINATKYIVGRARPTDNLGAYNFQPFSGHDSFMSGHTTEAFVLASVISEHYNSIWVQATAYSLAGTVGYARLNNDRHWPSDVLTGAVVGTFVGKTVVRFNRQHRKISIQPLVGPDIQGAEVSLPW